MFGRYRRVIIMRVSILLGGALVMVFGTRIAFLVLLIALKTGSDLYVFEVSRKTSSSKSSA
jgi:hypothetical protein